MAEATTSGGESGQTTPILPFTVTDQHLIACGVQKADAGKYAPLLASRMPAYKIDTKLRAAHFLAQVLHESGRLRITRENLNYSAKGLVKTFKSFQMCEVPTPAKTTGPAVYKQCQYKGKTRPGSFSLTESLAQAAAYAHQPDAIADRAYARLGGHLYIGRGLIQVTGKGNYHSLSEWAHKDYEHHPEWLEIPDDAVTSALWFWSTHNAKTGKKTYKDLNTLADEDNILAITRVINGGTNGLADRRQILHKCKKAFGGMLPVPKPKS